VRRASSDEKQGFNGTDPRKLPVNGFKNDLKASLRKHFAAKPATLARCAQSGPDVESNTMRFTPECSPGTASATPAQRIAAKTHFMTT
jgi:hypothetical protein